MFRGIIKLKSRFQQPIWKKLFCKNSYQIETGQLVCIACKRLIQHPVEYLQRNFFAKLVNRLLRSSGQKVFCFCKMVLLKFAKFTGIHLSQGLVLNKVPGLQFVTLFKKETVSQMFSCGFCKKFALQNISGSGFLRLKAVNFFLQKRVHGSCWTGF